MTEERPTVDESSRGWSAVREGQSDAECRKTCERGAKRTQILGMSYSTPRLVLGQGYSCCLFNGRFLAALWHGRSGMLHP
jgi:hypothetical protein